MVIGLPTSSRRILIALMAVSCGRPFVGSWIVIYLFQIGIITVLVRAGLGPFVAGLFVLPVSAVTSYFVQKRLVFRAARR